MADEYKWGVENGELVLYPAATTDYKPTGLPNWAWRSSPYVNEGAVHTGYMPVSKSYPVLERKDTAYIDLLDRVRVWSPPHGLNAVFSVTEMEIPLNKPEETKYKMGTEKQVSLTSINNSINEDLKKRITELPSKSSILAEAQQNAAAIINNSTSGYVTMRKGDGGYVEEIIISDEPNYEEANNIWRWNRNGLGFTNQGWNAPTYSLALTSDGSIVANRITTGVLSADRIRGGHLKIGGLDYAYDENGTPLPTLKDYSGTQIQVIKTGVDANGTVTETQEMRLDAGRIDWFDLGYSPTWEGAPGGHIAHVDIYGTPEGVPEGYEYPWLAIVAEQGIILNPHNLGVMESKDSGGWLQCVHGEEIKVLTNRAPEDEGDDSVETIEYIKNIEVDDTGKITNVEKGTMYFEKRKVVHGLVVWPDEYHIQV